MRTRRRATIDDLRQAIQCLPRETRIAMLDGIRGNDIIVGAYSTSDGICPMLAAHRAGGRTSLIAFAHAWDRFALATTKRKRARKATERELLILRTHLEASLLEDDDGPPTELAAAIAEHRALRQIAHHREPEEIAEHREPQETPSVRPGDPDRSGELRERHGWSWLRVMRRYDEYERALALLQSESRRERERARAG